MAPNPRTKAGRAQIAAELREQRLQALRYHPTLSALSEEELDWIISTVEVPHHRLDWFTRAPDIASNELRQMVARRT